ncbi:Cell cycle response regulator CtrA [Brevundimonas sp. NIBR10]|uniref:response regulator transcription factor n=1 Tax=Brevundimonas sp. NIBR10 TaxID=3015997 RepID=UPI0022F19127|nr:response regulator [Brevundimonas sp. NIBR10]WGM47236.1 Cell cycle response regulator CtrA [Brevundimonas sp. NIBR10]
MTQRVFVVEDDDLLREAVDLILTHAGYSLASTAVGNGAVNLVARFKPHLVLLDIRLPDISGLKLLSALRWSGYKAPILMMTTDSSAETVRDVLALGGNGYLLKPFEPKDLIGRVRAPLKPASGAIHYLDD